MKNQLNNKIKKTPKRDINFEIELNELKNNENMLIEKGYEYIEIGEFEKAFTIFSMGTGANNSDPEILNGLGIALFELGYYDKSRKILERAARLNPQDAITYANLAGIMWETGDFNKSIQYYTRSIEIDSEIEETYYNLINLYLETGYLYTAMTTCNHLINHFPENEENQQLMNEIIINLGISLI
jgi:tetratricopeptide (TPR) repeat protein